MATRHAQIHWTGGFTAGNGVVASSTSGAIDGSTVSWSARTENAGTATSPEELIAAAHGSCFCMALTGALERAGLTPQQLDVTVNVSFEQREGAWTITKSVLDVVGSISGIDEPAFIAFAEEAKTGCPVSRALAGNVAIELSASLSSEQLAAAAGP